jgi:hypothetical protein
MGAKLYVELECEVVLGPVEIPEEQPPGQPRWIGNVTGPYPSKPVPACTGTGFDAYGS